MAEGLTRVARCPDGGCLGCALDGITRFVRDVMLLEEPEPAEQETERELEIA